MVKYLFEHIIPFKEIDLKATYLVIFNIDKTPPHLALIKNNQYYSITIKEVELGIDIKPIIQLVTKKKIPTLFIEIDDNFDNIKEVFNTFDSLKNTTITCLTPIKKYLSQQYDFKPENVYVIFDLLNQIKDKNGIVRIFEMNTQKLLTPNNQLEINQYNYEELQQFINKLRENKPTSA
jgi:hypothetical protein